MLIPTSLNWPVSRVNYICRSCCLIEKCAGRTNCRLSASDFYVAILTHDETTTDGEQRARPNAIAETLLANQNWPHRLAILREGEVEMHGNLQGLGCIQLEGQWSVRLFQELRAAGLA